MRLKLYLLCLGGMLGTGAYAAEDDTNNVSPSTCYLESQESVGQLTCIDKNGEAGLSQPVAVKVESSSTELPTNLKLTLNDTENLDEAYGTYAIDVTDDGKSSVGELLVTLAPLIAGAALAEDESSDSLLVLVGRRGGGGGRGFHGGGGGRWHGGGGRNWHGGGNRWHGNNWRGSGWGYRRPGVVVGGWRGYGYRNYGYSSYGYARCGYYPYPPCNYGYSSYGYGYRRPGVRVGVGVWGGGYRGGYGGYRGGRWHGRGGIGRWR